MQINFGRQFADIVSEEWKKTPNAHVVLSDMEIVWIIVEFERSMRAGIKSETKLSRNELETTRIEALQSCATVEKSSES